MVTSRVSLLILASAALSSCAMTPPDPVAPESMHERIRKIEMNAIMTQATASNVNYIAGLLEKNPEMAKLCHEMGPTLLARAVRALYPSEELVRLLLEKGADPNAPCTKEWLILHGALAKKSQGILLLLLDAGADVNAKDMYGRTALNQAVFRSNWEAAEILLARGAEMDIFDAAGLGKNWRIRELLNRDPKLLEATDEMGRTPLHAAAKAGRKSTVELLLERGAYRFARDHIGLTPGDLARDKKHREVAELLR